MLALLTALVLAAHGTRATKIHPGGNSSLCLEAAGYASGHDVLINDCIPGEHQEWTISPGSTIVQFAGYNYCLDAGSTPANGVKMKVWQCYDNLPAQAWWLTDDGRIALEGQGLCLDLTDGSMVPGTIPQTWQCVDGNTNQVWTTSGDPVPTYTPPDPVSTAPTVTATIGPIET